MPIFTFVNNLNTTLAAPVSPSATNITLASTANLPASIPASEVLVITLNDSATRQNFEILYATARTGATLTVLRAQEGTGALSWLTGDFAYSPPTAGQQESFGQLAESNTWTGANTFDDPVTIAPAVNADEAMQLGQATGRLLAVRRLTFSGTYNPTVGTTRIIVELVGGGGGGGGSSPTVAGQISIASGGGSGAYAKSLITSGFSGVFITIGPGGIGGFAGGNGGNGSVTSFGTLLSAAGGFGGGVGQASIPPFTQIGSPGGALPITGNILNSAGNSGLTSTAATIVSFVSGAGGSSFLGAGGAPQGTSTAGGISGALFGFGGGGSGGLNGASTPGQSGGPGAPGLIIVYEYT